MTEVAGEVCDGFICHGFTTERYLREVTLPALQKGQGEGGQDDGGLRDRRSELRRHRARTRRRWPRPARARSSRSPSTARRRRTAACSSCTAGASLQDELNRLSKEGKWVEMGDLIDDEILETFAVVGEPEQVAPELLKRYGDCIDRINFYTPYKSDPERWAAVRATLQAG